jgi:2-(1,2-epoxy-1,2-dihydrophenyl)acetyl-CoA isomerase
MSDLLERTEDGIAWLTLNRPGRLNAFSPAMLQALGEALQRSGSDAEVGTIVVTGAGRGFCAGGDVKTMENRATQGFEERVEGLRRMHQLPMLLRTIPKIVIAMVNGPAVGAGLGLALACDLRIAGRSARFGTGFAGVGYSGDFGGSWTLTRLVGTAKARELYFLGEIIDSATAASLALLNRVVEDDVLHRETTALARRIADGPRVAYGYMKRNLFAAETEPFTAVLEMEAVHQARTAMTRTIEKRARPSSKNAGRSSKAGEHEEQARWKVYDRNGGGTRARPRLRQSARRIGGNAGCRRCNGARVPAGSVGDAPARGI